MIINKKSIKGNGIYDKTMNFLTGSKLKSGEMHVPMWQNGKIVTAAYSGPGTKIVENLKEGKQPINLVDRTAMAHDIRYSLSSNLEGIKQADKKMVDKLEKLQKEGKEKWVNIAPSKYGIKFNQLVQKVLPSKYADKFVNYMTNYKDFNQKLNDEDRKLLTDKLKELEQEGYGKKKRKKRTNKKTIKK
jgi:hypothetical protein